MQASRDYCLGEQPPSSVQGVMQQLGLPLPSGQGAQLFECASDLPAADLVLVMDKFTAADVLREVGGWGAWTGGPAGVLG